MGIHWRKEIFKNEYTMLTAIILVFVVLFWIYVFFTRFDTIIRVKRDIIHGDRKTTTNYITVEDGRMFKVQNNLLAFYLDAPRVQAGLEDGKKYRVRGYGLYIPSLGIFPNITSIVERYD
jgi:hypothetical protein